MGLNIVLEGEDGRPVASYEDDRGTLAGLLPAGDADFPLLRWVDPYGDTVYNRLQAGPLVEELERLDRPGLGVRESKALGRLKELARRCSDEPHLYLRLKGD